MTGKGEKHAVLDSGFTGAPGANGARGRLRAIKAHVSHILQKLGLESRVQAALYALRHNVAPLDEV